MDPITASILLSAGTNLAGFGLKKFLGSGRPDYEIPDSARQALSMARIQAADPNIPGEQKAIERAGVSAANSARVAQESGNALEALPSIQGQYDVTTQGILARSEADHKNDQQRLAQQLAQMAHYDDMRYQMNEYAPYAEKQQETRDLVGALSTNLSSALLHQGLGGSTSDAMTTDSAPKFSVLTEDGPYSTMADAPILGTPTLPQLPYSVKPVGADMQPLIDYGIVTAPAATLPQKTIAPMSSGTSIDENEQIRILLELLQKQPTN